jgi:hypothetical protein
MLAKTVQTYLTNAETSAYEFLNNRSRLGRALLAWPVVALEVGANTLGSRLSAIEAAAFTALNLISAPFSSKYTVKDALLNAKLSLFYTAQTPVLVTMASYKVFWQTVTIMFSGKEPLSFKKNSVNIIPNWGKPDYSKAGVWTCNQQIKLYHKPLSGWDAIPVAAQDVGLNVLRPILQMIESVAFTALNLVGFPFIKNCTLKAALIGAERVFLSASQIPVELAMAIPQFLYQTGAILTQQAPLPVDVQSHPA